MIENLRFLSYRNIADGEVALSSRRVFLVGENGQGKSNFLDAIYLLCFGSSFRGTRDSEAVRKGGSIFSLIGNFARDGMKESVCIRFENGKKTIRSGDKPVRDRKDLVARYPTIVFCHSDFEFAHGEPERRRFFFDQTASLAHPGYIDSFRDFRRVLKTRNLALKGKRVNILDVLDEQLVTYGISLSERRQSITTEFSGVFSDNHEKVSRIGSRVSIEYRPSWKFVGDRGKALDELRRRRPDELALGTTLSGPHRDRFSFIEAARDFTTTASTGQLRLLSLLLRTAQADYCTRVTGRAPVLLLDDVLLELDPDKRSRFMETLPDHEQAIFTFLPGEPYETYLTDDALVYWVDHGRFTSKNGC
ncbi:MAG: DNA replication and repair protein RecF [Spirochaetes bacterium]|nr:DNA replication and repair protein RecF [Spirochaetota bacterium]